MAKSRIEEAFERRAQGSYARAPWHRAACEYIATGERKQLSKVKPGARLWEFYGLDDALAHPPAWSDEDRRALQVLGAARLDGVLEWWMPGVLAGEGAGEDRFGAVRAELEDAGLDASAVAQIAIHCGKVLECDGRPTSMGRFLLGLSDRALRDALAAAVKDNELGGGVSLVMGLLLGSAPDRVAGLLPVVLGGYSRSYWLPPVCAVLIDRGGERHEAAVRKAFRAEKNPGVRFSIGQALDRLAPDRHGAEVLAAARDWLAVPADQIEHPSVVRWMLARFPAETLGEVAAYVASPRRHDILSRSLTEARDVLGAGAAPILLSAVEHGEEALRLEALDHLLGVGGHADEVRAAVATGLGGEKGEFVVRYLQLAARVAAPELSPRIWALLGHASKPVRDAAARALGRLGDPSVAPAVEQLGARKAATRVAAVTILAIVASPAALAALEARLDVEE